MVRQLLLLHFDKLHSSYIPPPADRADRAALQSNLWRSAAVVTSPDLWCGCVCWLIRERHSNLAQYTSIRQQRAPTLAPDILKTAHSLSVLHFTQTTSFSLLSSLLCSPRWIQFFQYSRVHIKTSGSKQNISIFESFCLDSVQLV